MRRVDNPPNPFDTTCREYLEEPPRAALQIFEESAASIISANNSPDIPFNFSVNPYRGCQHACAYCYARTFHEYLNLGAGTDFDTKLVAKVNAPELLRRELSKPKYRGEHIHFSGITDCYQPIEASYRLTRRCLEVCHELQAPVSIITKSFLIVRDLDLLVEMNARAGVTVCISVPFADAAMCRSMEPGAPPPARRIEIIRRLADAGVSVGVLIAPIVPGLNDTQIPEILQRIAEAGAESACYTPVRLPGSVEAVFLKRMAQVMPLRYARVKERISAMRNGRLNETRFRARMRGTGVYWRTIQQMISVHRRRLGLSGGMPSVPRPAERQAERSQRPTQLSFNFHPDE
ncbi:MAG: PA0069 family radical SAM protein [bacterium]|nr:PA0069 family radical SAM protein [bacterium]